VVLILCTRNRQRIRRYVVVCVRHCGERIDSDFTSLWW